jgi:30S ribosomal protein S31
MEGPMGKGDRRSRRGKIWRGSHGKTRPKKKKGAVAKTTKPTKPTKSARSRAK